jgi:transposase
VAQRRKHTGQFKASVAVETIAGHKTVNEISAEYSVNASQIHKWKKQAMEHFLGFLNGGRPGRRNTHEAVESRLYYQRCGLKASDVAVMYLMDEQYTRTPYYGVKRWRDFVSRPFGGPWQLGVLGYLTPTRDLSLPARPLQVYFRRLELRSAWMAGAVRSTIYL